jgi:hypothetical protein
VFDDKTLRTLLSFDESNVSEQAFRHDIHALITEDMSIDANAMLRRLYGITIVNAGGAFSQDGTKYIYTITGQMKGRTEVAVSAVDLVGLNGEAWGNAVKATETQAKRRLTTSLVGYGYKKSGEDSEAKTSQVVKVAEPIVEKVPEVNNAPATVVEDTRIETTMIPPAVTEAKVEKMLSTLSKETNAPERDPANDPAPKKGTPEPEKGTEQQSLFDLESSIEEPKDSATLLNELFPEKEPVKIAIAETSLEVPAVVEKIVDQTPAEEPPPPPVQDIQPVVSTSEKPTLQQYRALTLRVTKIVRDVLPKAGNPGKEAAKEMPVFLRKVLGVQDFSQANNTAFEEVLGRLESAKTPAEVVSIIKGGK